MITNQMFTILRHTETFLITFCKKRDSVTSCYEHKHFNEFHEPLVCAHFKTDIVLCVHVLSKKMPPIM